MNPFIFCLLIGIAWISIRNMLFFKPGVFQGTVLLFILICNALLIQAAGHAGIIVLLFSVCVYIGFLDKQIWQNISGILFVYLLFVFADQFLYYLNADDTVGYVVVLVIIVVVSGAAGKSIRRFYVKSRLYLAGPELFRLIAGDMILCSVIFVLNGVYFADGHHQRPGLPVHSMFYGGVFVIGVAAMVSAVRQYTLKAEARASREALLNLREYMGQLEAMYSEMRAFRHDYRNIMGSMQAYIEQQDLAGLREYFYRKIEPVGDKIMAGDVQLDKLRYINSMEIKSLLSAKIICAHESGIEVTVEIRERVSFDGIDLIRMIRLLGILMDNAIEGALGAVRPELNVASYRHQKSVVLEIRNSYDKAKVKKKPGGAGFLSGKGAGRGIGLVTAGAIVNEYENLINETRLEDEYFIQYLELFD